MPDQVVPPPSSIAVRGPRKQPVAQRRAGEGPAPLCGLITASAAAILAACSGSAAGGWVKAGADEAQTARAYRDCAALTDTATRTDADIEQDIAASRASDLQHSAILREHARTTRESNRDRADALLASCMQAKGFTRDAK